MLSIMHAPGNFDIMKKNSIFGRIFNIMKRRTKKNLCNKPLIFSFIMYFCNIVPVDILYLLVSV